MKYRSLLFGALLGGITSVPVVALLYLGQEIAGFPFLPYDLFDSLTRALPGGLATASIEALVQVIRALGLGPTDEVAKIAEHVLALSIPLAGGALLGLAIVALQRHGALAAPRLGAIGGTLFFLASLGLEIGRGSLTTPSLAVLWLALLIVGWGAVLGTLLGQRRPYRAERRAGEQHRAARRALLLKIAGGAMSLALASWGLGLLLAEQRRATGAGEPLSSLPPPGDAATPAGSPVGGETTPAPGTRPAVTSNEDFYRIDISLRPPVIYGASWTLGVRGLFDHPRPLGLTDLMSFPAVTQPVTLSCISNPVGGDLIGSTFWNGLRLRDLLAGLGLRPAAQELYVEAADGFYESVTMADLLDHRTLLVYGMNGVSLPAEHGFPLRIIIPNRYGMKQPKWIVSIEAIDRIGQGYWVDRGWSREARPQIVSVIDRVANDSIVDGRVPVGGIAWAGDRGIRQVEVQVDGGNWQPARLIPPLGPLAWVQWRYDWARLAGRHTFRVRATDGTGALQIAQLSDTHPSGATGYHSVTATT